MSNDIKIPLIKLSQKLEGELLYDDLIKAIYATDASVYRILPLAVAFPKTEEDIIEIINFARLHDVSIVPRAAGTSLAGQCVGSGIILDTSKYFKNIIKLDLDSKTVRVQPGVVRDSLNNYLKPFGLFFGPNTSTSNRCTIGGMVGNNSSGTTSIKYGVTRDKVVRLRTILSDGSKIEFEGLTMDVLEEKKLKEGKEGELYSKVIDILSNKKVRTEIKERFPKAEIHRRNTGYAVDELIKTSVFSDGELPFNFCKLLCGSEGTLAVTTEITLQLDDLPPSEHLMIAAHFRSISDCLKAVVPVMKHHLYGCEMMDKTILDCTKKNKEQQENRSFINGDPEAILMLELRADSKQLLNDLSSSLINELTDNTNSYANVILEGLEVYKATELRKAGLGLLGNLVGDAKGVACIEDTAVALNDLANYIDEFSELMEAHKQKAVYYAHAGAGEIHLRPILNLKDKKDVELFKLITDQVADLVLKYNGSMSGEHGDGIVRSYLIKRMIGSNNYSILRHIKDIFDPNNILNPGKIIDGLPMQKNLRYEPGRNEPDIKTTLDFSKSLGILRESEKCNGSGDCLKMPEFGGTMCPSYRATKNEKDTTRGRANALREFLTHSDKANKFNHKELKEVFDLCLSCKACSTECPSSVDVAALKAEFQHQYHKDNGVSIRDRIFANNNFYNAKSSNFPRLSNFLVSCNLTTRIIKTSLGIAKQRSLPKVSLKSFKSIYKKNNKRRADRVKNTIKKVYLFNDEFTNFLDSDIGEDALNLLTALNYEVILIDNFESGRSFISKGFLKKAKMLADKNLELFRDKISENSPLIGIEPSAILTFVDEYPRLASDKEVAESVAKHTYLIEEFLQNEIHLGNINSSQFTKKPLQIKYHGHCYQKALRNQLSSFELLNLPENYKVTIIPSGCCGMAGSFGYEKEHYDISMAIGEQTLFPAVRKTDNSTLIAANGTSCRHQIKDGTGRSAKHPISIMVEALKT